MNWRKILSVGLVGFILAVLVDYFLKPSITVGVKRGLRTR